MKPFKPIAAPKRTPKPTPKTQARGFKDNVEINLDALRIRRLLREMRWDNQGGYSGRSNGRWDFVSTGLGRVTPDELDKLFKFAGMTPDEIDVVGDCVDCANSDEGYERGYSAPCSSCLRPSHINNFVPLTKIRRAGAK